MSEAKFGDAINSNLRMRSAGDHLRLRGAHTGDAQKKSRAYFDQDKPKSRKIIDKATGLVDYAPIIAKAIGVDISKIRIVDTGRQWATFNVLPCVRGAKAKYILHTRVGSNRPVANMVSMYDADATRDANVGTPVFLPLGKSSVTWKKHFTGVK